MKNLIFKFFDSKVGKYTRETKLGHFLIVYLITVILYIPLSLLPTLEFWNLCAWGLLWSAIVTLLGTTERRWF